SNRHTKHNRCGTQIQSFKSLFRYLTIHLNSNDVINRSRGKVAIIIDLRKHTSSLGIDTSLHLDSIQSIIELCKTSLPQVVCLFLLFDLRIEQIVISLLGTKIFLSILFAKLIVLLLRILKLLRSGCELTSLILNLLCSLFGRSCLIVLIDPKLILFVGTIILNFQTIDLIFIEIGILIGPEFCQTILFSKKISICFSSFLLVSTDLRNHLVILLLSNLYTRRLNLDRFGRMLHLLCQHFIGRRRILIFSNPKLVLGICNLLQSFVCFELILVLLCESLGNGFLGLRRARGTRLSSGRSRSSASGSGVL